MPIDKVIENILSIKIWANNKNIMSALIACPIEGAETGDMASVLA